MSNQSMDFEKFVSDIKTNGWQVHGVEVYKDNELIHSYGDTIDNFHEIYSATKSILSLATGIAYDRGLIDLNKSILEYLPIENVSKLSDTGRKTFEVITMERLLTMSVGELPFRHNGEYYLDDILKYEISNPTERVFNYSNITAFLAGATLQCAIGEDLGLFIERNILRPLYIYDYEYSRTPEDYFYGASNMKLTVNGLSQIGLLLVNDGVFEGKQIVSKEYLRKATSVQQMGKDGGYGYFIWQYRDGFSINGKWCQKCYCLPKSNMVITYLSHIEENTGELKASMERNILGYN